MKIKFPHRPSAHRVCGVVAPGARPTKLAAFLLATAISALFLFIVGVVKLAT